MTISKEALLEGQVLLVNKPLHWTSFQVVNKLRWLIKKQYGLKKIKVGHAGTLDPLATGLLIICTGKQTKKIDTYQAQEKEYTGTLTLGATTPSFDLETEVDQRFDTSSITETQIIETAKQFMGSIEQYPPLYSAIKQDGKRLYEIARKGETVAIKARTVTVSKFQITQITMPDVQFLVNCSKGTYIRSLASDFGKALNNGAHLSALCRTKIGDFSIENAISIDTFKTLLESPS